MGAQREICHQIIDKGGNYVISLKGNQGNLYKDVVLYIAAVS
jgi:predicted transposase YbfD/YdcC